MPRTIGILALLSLATLCVAPTSDARPRKNETGSKVTMANKTTEATKTTEACVPTKPMPALDLPWSTVEELCAANHGKPWDQAAPPTGEDWRLIEDDYAVSVQSFLRRLRYRDELGWVGDARWRLTGEYAGCPDGENEYYGVHPAVRIYYSPAVMTWLCAGRQGELPDGAMIVKEMASPSNLAQRPNSDKLWIDADYDDTFGSWTVMIKGKEGAKDGWFWGYFAKSSYFNPPLIDRSAFASDPSIDPPPNSKWYPTYYGHNDVEYPNYGFGNYCTYCHASAVSELTFSDLGNVLGEEIEYSYLGARIPPPPAAEISAAAEALTLPFVPDIGDIHAKNTPDTPTTGDRGPFPAPRSQPTPEFERVYAQFAGTTFENVWPSRLPAQTWDHVAAGPDGPEQFVTSDQCMSCHDASGAEQRLPNMVVMREDGSQVNLTPFAEWGSSPMGLAGRDPIFYAQLESERNQAGREAGLKDKIACIENTCLHCHGVMGQRQLALDTQGLDQQGQEETVGDLCDDFQPKTAEDKRLAGYGGQLFRRTDAMAWRGQDPAMAKYGGLARDGISCTVCHHISDLELGEPATYTGQFRVGPADEIYGPFDDVKEKPMEHALGMTPRLGKAVLTSEICGSCHTVELPVFDTSGNLTGTKFEQTTYFEWLNSDFNPQRQISGGKSCQDCHMPHEYTADGQRIELTEKIANIQDETFPEADNILPPEDIDLEPRSYRRHTLYGLNVFLNAMFEQFPLLLGVRQISFMNPGPDIVPPLITARESVLHIARNETAEVRVNDLQRTSDGLTFDVTVQNLTGHSLPSGVGFRRAFLEVVVVDGKGRPLWASGLTSPLGLIQDGLSGNDLPTELLLPGPDGVQQYQTHHTVITEGSQVQIYEELTKDSDGRFTTSFLHRSEEVKDNRLRPKGWRHDGPQAENTEPGPGTHQDPDYNSPTLTGSDTVTYDIPLPAKRLRRAKAVRATLYYQSTAPYFLHQRFDNAAAGPYDEDTKRLYYMLSHLNTQATDEDGKPYIQDYKLRIAGDRATLR